MNHEYESLAARYLPSVSRRDLLRRSALLAAAGPLVLDARLRGAEGKETDKGSGRGGDVDHLENFVESIRGHASPNAEIAEGAKSPLFCHLANIA